MGEAVGFVADVLQQSQAVGVAAEVGGVMFSIAKVAMTALSYPLPPSISSKLRWTTEWRQPNE